MNDEQEMGAGFPGHAGIRATGGQPMSRGVARGARVHSERRVAAGVSPGPTFPPGIFIGEILSDLVTRAVPKFPREDHPPCP